MDISAAAASKNIDRLEQLDLVVRQAHSGDRRSMEVKLLPKGRSIVDEISEVTTQKMAPLMDQFSADEKTTLLDFLQRIVKYTLADEISTDLICLQCGGNCGEVCVVKAGRGICARPKKT